MLKFDEFGCSGWHACHRDSSRSCIGVVALKSMASGSIDSMASHSMSWYVVEIMGAINRQWGARYPQHQYSTLRFLKWLKPPDAMRLLDMDSGGAVEIEEFLLGCLHLRGNVPWSMYVRLKYDRTWYDTFVMFILLKLYCNRYSVLTGLFFTRQWSAQHSMFISFIFALLFIST